MEGKGRKLHRLFRGRLPLGRDRIEQEKSLARVHLVSCQVSLLCMYPLDWYGTLFLVEGPGEPRPEATPISAAPRPTF